MRPEVVEPLWNAELPLEAIAVLDVKLLRLHQGGEEL